MENKKSKGKINDIIEYFKEEKTRYENDYAEQVRDNQKQLNISVITISIVTMIILGVTRIINFSENSSLPGILFSIPFILIALFFALYIWHNNKDSNEYVPLICSLEVIIKMLHSFKIRELTLRDLKPLMEKIKQDNYDNRISLVNRPKQYSRYRKQRLNEFIECIDKINNSVKGKN